MRLGILFSRNDPVRLDYLLSPATSGRMLQAEMKPAKNEGLRRVAISGGYFLQ